MVVLWWRFGSERRPGGAKLSLMVRVTAFVHQVLDLRQTPESALEGGSRDYLPALWQSRGLRHG